MTATRPRRTVRQPRKGIVSKLIAVMEVKEQLWLPLEMANTPHAHAFARISGFKIQTRTVYKGGIKGIRIKRVA